MDENNQHDGADQTSNEPELNDLDSLKKRALIGLASVLGDLQNISPEQKFDICIKAIRFTDEQNLVSVALDAALLIEENGARAEALLQLVNEIDYLQNGK